MRFVELTLGSGQVRLINPAQVAYIRVKTNPGAPDSVWLVFGAAAAGVHEFSVKGTLAEVRAQLEDAAEPAPGAAVSDGAVAAQATPRPPRAKRAGV